MCQVRPSHAQLWLRRRPGHRLDAPTAARFVDRFRGHLVSRSNAELVAAFDGPARAVRCATALMVELDVGGEARAGVHTGECVAIGSALEGPAVAVARSIASLARPGEVLVTQTVQDLVTGSSLAFRPRGQHMLTESSPPWHVFAAVRG